jgi:hypothetical protein
MKYFFPILMALVILSGISLIATPYIAEQFFPASATTFHAAKPGDVKKALADWFGTPVDTLSNTQGITQTTAQEQTSWFMFNLERQPVEKFIHQNRLQQQDLTPETLQQIFLQNSPPAPWWQPASLERQTCFIGMDDGRELDLIYNAERQEGFLVVKAHIKPAKF